MQLEKLIAEASAIAGSQNKLATALGTQSGVVSEWRNGLRHCPDKYVVAMARIAGRDPLRTALEVYKERLGKLALISLAGAVAIMSTFAPTDANAHCAGLKPTGDNV